MKLWFNFFQNFHLNSQMITQFKFCLKKSTEVSKTAELLADLESLENKTKTRTKNILSTKM